MECAWRSSRHWPISSSNALICRLNAGCVKKIFCAARLMLPVSATATKCRSCRSSMRASITKRQAQAKNLALAGSARSGHRVRMKTIETTLNIRRANERGHADHGWLNSHHTFSFADYYDPAHMGFRSLRVINDDRVAAGQGFGTHPHRDMEIFSYVLEGALEHKDSLGNGSVLKPGQIQLMSAGRGVTHSEFNPLPGEPLHFLQIWIQPRARGLTPGYTEWLPKTEQADAPKVLVISSDGRDGSATIHQDADISL